MTAIKDLSDLELASLISSKICHDVISPVGAIYNGLEVLDDDPDAESRAYALDVIRNFTQQASAKLQFARFAFGAAGTAGSVIDLKDASEISKGLLSDGKHRLDWAVPPGHLPKDQVKLLLNMIASSVTALPRGGDIRVSTSGQGAATQFSVTCNGEGARPPQHLEAFIAGDAMPELDAMTIQAYFTTRLAETAGMTLAVTSGDNTVVLTAKPNA